MIKTFVEAWFENKDKLMKMYRTHEVRWDYDGLVKNVFSFVINPYLKKNGNTIYSTDDTVSFTRECYQGDEIHIIPILDGSVDQTVCVSSYYGSCSGCDTLCAIFDDMSAHSDKLTEDGLKCIEYMSLHIIQTLKFINSKTFAESCSVERKVIDTKEKFKSLKTALYIGNLSIHQVWCFLDRVLLGDHIPEEALLGALISDGGKWLLINENNQCEMADIDAVCQNDISFIELYCDKDVPIRGMYEFYVEV